MFLLGAHVPEFLSSWNIFGLLVHSGSCFRLYLGLAHADVLTEASADRRSRQSLYNMLLYHCLLPLQPLSA